VVYIKTEPGTSVNAVARFNGYPSYTDQTKYTSLGSGTGQGGASWFFGRGSAHKKPRGWTEKVSTFVKDPISRSELKGLDMVDSCRSERDERMESRNDSGTDDPDEMEAWAIYRANRTEEEIHIDNLEEGKVIHANSKVGKGSSSSSCSNASSCSSRVSLVGRSSCRHQGWGLSQGYDDNVSTSRSYPPAPSTPAPPIVVTRDRVEVEEGPLKGGQPTTPVTSPVVQVVGVPIDVDRGVAIAVPVHLGCVSSPGALATSPIKRYYVVLNGRDGFSGVIDNWEVASLYSMGASRSTVKRYATHAEAERAVNVGLAALEEQRINQLISVSTSSKSGSGSGHM
jgi:hypothetical protein